MALDLSRISALEKRIALEELNNNVCYFLDHCMIDELIEQFTEDALYVHGTRSSIGREEIRMIFDKRGAAGPRTARHMQTGLRLEFEGVDKARGESVCMTFAEDALPPIDQAQPYLVADFIDEYRLCKDAQWRIAQRKINRIFVSPSNTGPVGRT